MKATLQTVLAIGVVYAVQSVLSALSLPFDPLFVFSLPISENPWTLITSIYAHGGATHLLSNVIGILIFGSIVESVTTEKRFHIFFIVTGIIAAVSQLFFAVVTSTPTGILGASGAIFALMGYAAVGNDVTRSVIDFLKLSPIKTYILFGIFGIGVTIITASPGVAAFAHGVGFLCGAVCGYGRVLHTNSI